MCGRFMTVQFVTFLVVTLCHSYTPVVIWHGIGDTCCNNTITGILEANLINYLPGIHTLNIQVGGSEIDDFRNTFFMHPNKQIEVVCNMIKSDPLLADGYNAIAISQASQFLRGVAQRCPEPRMKNLVSMAGQHQGVYGVPECDAYSIPFCDSVRLVLSQEAYSEFVQNTLTPAGYWHDPLNKEAYVHGSTFLADINNEKYINQTYIKNLQLLERFIMVKYGADKVVQPIETQWFGFYKQGQSTFVETLQESELYISDRLGLKKMEEDGKLVFLSNTWEHPDFDWNWFRKNIVDKFLK